MDDFSDDDFDALNANALQELENSAIQFTQAQKSFEPRNPPPARALQPQHDVGYDFEDDDLDDAVVVVQDALLPSAALPPAPAPAPAPKRPAQLPSRIPPQQHQQQQQQQQQQKETWRPVSVQFPLVASAPHLLILSPDPLPALRQSVLELRSRSPGAKLSPIARYHDLHPLYPALLPRYHPDTSRPRRHAKQDPLA